MHLHYMSSNSHSSTSQKCFEQQTPLVCPFDFNQYEGEMDSQVAKATRSCHAVVLHEQHYTQQHIPQTASTAKTSTLSPLLFRAGYYSGQMDSQVTTAVLHIMCYKSSFTHSSTSQKEVWTADTSTVSPWLQAL